MSIYISQSYLNTTFRLLEATEVCIVCYSSIKPGRIYCDEHTVDLSDGLSHHGCGESRDRCFCYFGSGIEQIDYSDDDVVAYRIALKAVLIISSYFKKYKRRKSASVT